MARDTHPPLVPRSHPLADSFFWRSFDVKHVLPGNCVRFLGSPPWSKPWFPSSSLPPPSLKRPLTRSRNRCNAGDFHFRIPLSYRFFSRKECSFLSLAKFASIESPPPIGTLPKNSERKGIMYPRCTQQGTLADIPSKGELGLG